VSSPALPLARVDSKADSHLDTMASGEETFLTDTAPPVLQNLGREMSWIDATAEAAMMESWEIGCGELIERDLRAGLKAHIPLSLDSDAGIDMTTVVHHTSRRRMVTDRCLSATISHGVQRRVAAVLVVF
jgi:hypothetical protein